MSRDGARVYVVNRGSKALSVIDTGTQRVTGIIPLDGDPGSLAVTPDGRHVYVNIGDAHAVSVVAAG